MRRRQEEGADAVDFELSRCRGQPGWEQLRILYHIRNPRHLRQVDAVIDALLKARRAGAREDDEADEVTT
jgi:hypothetical protein